MEFQRESSHLNQNMKPHLNIVLDTLHGECNIFDRFMFISAAIPSSYG